MNLFPQFLFQVAALLGGLVVAPGLAVEAPLTAGKPVVLAGTHGRFDFLGIDPVRKRLLAAHTGNESLDIIDLDSGALIKAIPVGAAQGTAADPQHYYASVSKPAQLVVVDAGKLEVVGKVPLSGPADVMAFNPQTGLAYVCHDDAKEVWVVNPAQKKVIATIDLPSDSPEDLAFDPAFHRLYQNLKTASQVAVIDPETKKVIALWPVAPAQSPHGMAVVHLEDAVKTQSGTGDFALYGIAVVGGNGKLVVLDLKDGRVAGSCDVAERVDQIAYDPGLNRVYCASGAGKISVVQIAAGKLSSLGDVPSSEGAHSIAVDPKTHTVWIVYAKGETSIVQPFTPPAQ